MIRVRLRRDGDVCALSAKGHATGSIAVCAAVSGLLSALEAWLREADVTLCADRLKPGDALLIWRGGAAGQAVYRLAEIALRQLEAAEPERIEIFFPPLGENARTRVYDRSVRRNAYE